MSFDWEPNQKHLLHNCGRSTKQTKLYLKIISIAWFRLKLKRLPSIYNLSSEPMPTAVAIISLNIPYMPTSIKFNNDPVGYANLLQSITSIHVKENGRWTGTRCTQQQHSPNKFFRIPFKHNFSKHKIIFLGSHQIDDSHYLYMVRCWITQPFGLTYTFPNSILWLSIFFLLKIKWKKVKLLIKHWLSNQHEFRFNL